MTTIQNRLCNLDPATLFTALEQDQVILIDVREPSEFARERLAGATRLSLSSFDCDRVPQDPHKQLVLYCQTGNRSGQAAQQLFAAGFTQVSHLEGGLTQWKQQGYPTLLNKKAPISIMRQVQIIAGSLILLGTILGAFISPGFLFLSGFVGAGLTFAGLSGTCAMATLLSKLPYNQPLS